MDGWRLWQLTQWWCQVKHICYQQGIKYMLLKLFSTAWNLILIKCILELCQQSFPRNNFTLSDYFLPPPFCIHLCIHTFLYSILIKNQGQIYYLFTSRLRGYCIQGYVRHIGSLEVLKVTIQLVVDNHQQSKYFFFVVQKCLEILVRGWQNFCQSWCEHGIRKWQLSQRVHNMSFPPFTFILFCRILLPPPPRQNKMKRE